MPSSPTSSSSSSLSSSSLLSSVAPSSSSSSRATLPITVLIAAKNEQANIRRCIEALAPAERIVVLDSNSSDQTESIAVEAGAEVVQFAWAGGYPKKRQWALDTLPIESEWVLLIDADEVVPPNLWAEIETAIAGPETAFLITKGFHFLGQRFRFGGFSFSDVLLFRTGQAAFEKIVRVPDDTLDMEVHERVIVNGVVGRLRTPLIHDDFKGLEAYLDRHNRYSTWEAYVRFQSLDSGTYGEETIRPRLFGNSQERRRFLKRFIIRAPGEPLAWFLYHYVFMAGFLEGRKGWIAARIRSQYIAQVRWKVFELRRGRQ